MNIHERQDIPMHTFRLSIVLASLLVAACSPKPAPQADVAPVTTPASVAMPAPASVAAAQADEAKCTNEPRTDENDKRPRCGGMVTPQPQVSHAYRITLDNGESFTACDITQPFKGKIGGGMVMMSFKPDGDKGGTVAWHFAGGGGMADTAYDYALDGPADRMTGTFRASAAVCGKGSGLAACAAAKKQTFSSTWTRIDACAE
ncbi:MAG: hypothetical protein QM719_07005 [Thermomonas sp.]